MHRHIAVLALAGAFLASPASADPSGPLYERALMVEANRRCGLFTPEVRAALSASRLQAHTAAVRAKLDVLALERRARLRAATVPCRSADIQLAAARVRHAHAGWSRILWMNFPGAAGSWRADRVPSEETRWRLVQRDSATAAFGLAGRDPRTAPPVAVVRLPRKARPALARLTVGRRIFLAETRAPAPEPLALSGRGRSWLFGFPPAVSDALAALPPDGTVQLDVLAAGGRQTVLARMSIEPGDYAAARAFLQQPAPVTAAETGSPGRSRPVR
jgi:hypothetical protein